MKNKKRLSMEKININNIKSKSIINALNLLQGKSSIYKIESKHNDLEKKINYWSEEFKKRIWEERAQKSCFKKC